MNTTRLKFIGGAMAAVAICVAAELASRAQLPAAPRQPSYGQAATQSPAGAQLSMDAEREQIWNSPNMLRARAWLQEYCQTSARFRPEDEKKFLTELEHLTPTQMQLWLLKFDQEEESKQQQYAIWQQAHSAALTRAMAADKATQQSYAAINRGENAAAGEEQQQINEQTEAAQQMQEEKAAPIAGAGPYGPYGYYPGYGGIHYHFHLYPY